MTHLDIGDDGLQRAAPVDEHRVAVDQSLVMHAHKGLGDGARQFGTQREHLARPVQRCSRALLLSRSVHHSTRQVQCACDLPAVRRCGLRTGPSTATPPR